jgi:Tol biopolymer transport system component
VVAFAPNGNFMISHGRFDMADTNGQPYPATVDETNLATGEVSILWERAWDTNRLNYFTAFMEPRISPDEQFLTFNYGPGLPNPGTVYLIDRTGREYGQFNNTYALGWRPNGDLVLAQVLETDQHRLLYWTLDGETQPVFNTEPGIEIVSYLRQTNNGEAWSPDGRFFVYTLYNNHSKTEQLYLWRPDSGQPQLIYTTLRDIGIYNVLWIPDSSGFYFDTGESFWQHKALWRYDVPSAAP